VTILLYANNATSTLQSGISSSATSLTLATGTGSLFPAIGAGQAFYMTLVDAATQLINEIVLVTARAGDACTVVRHQQGTTAKTWAASDIASQLVTAGDISNFLQGAGLQSGLYNYAVGTGANSITATLPSALTSLGAGFQVIIQSAAVNTGAATLTLTLGTTVQPAKNIVKGNGSALAAGDIPGANYPIELVYNGTNFVMSNPVTSSTANLAGGAANEILIQIGSSTTGFLGAPASPDVFLHYDGSAFAWVHAVDSFNGRIGNVTPQTGDYTAAQVGAVSTASVTGGNQLHAQNGFQVLPGGTIIQWGLYPSTIPGGTSFSVTFPMAFPSFCAVAMAFSGNLSVGSSYVPLYLSAKSTTGATFGSQGGSGSPIAWWFAVGY
jgi:hypothetical protein